MRGDYIAERSCKNISQTVALLCTLSVWCARGDVNPTDKSVYYGRTVKQKVKYDEIKTMTVLLLSRAASGDNKKKTFLRRAKLQSVAY